MVHAPVGIRCPDCARARPVPTYDVSGAFMARAIGAGAVLGIAGGLIVSLIILSVPIPLLWWALIGGLGYVVGEGISMAANRKRGRKLKFVAAGAVFVAVALINRLTGVPYDLFGLLASGIAFYIAVNRF
jgi:xanthosine utilization system XapX-like protein